MCLQSLRLIRRLGLTYLSKIKIEKFENDKAESQRGQPFKDGRLSQ